jgi:Flp pilus assembly protein TadG
MSASVLKKFRWFGADARGVAGIEFAVTGLMLAGALLNAVDVGYYIYRRMEVENAADVGAQAAWKTCSSQSSLLPATQNCTVANGASTSLNSAITAAIQSTSLGTAVTLATGYPEEGDYCVNASNLLQCVGSLSTTAPANCSATGQQSTCSAAGNASATPGDYILVQVTYPYQSLFPGLTVMGALGITSITKTSWMRLA